MLPDPRNTSLISGKRKQINSDDLTFPTSLQCLALSS